MSNTAQGTSNVLGSLHTRDDAASGDTALYLAEAYLRACRWPRTLVVASSPSGPLENVTSSRRIRPVTQIATVVLTAAQIRSLVGTPITLVAAVGGSYHEPVALQFMLDFGTVAFDDAAALGNLVVSAAGGGIGWAVQEADGLVDAVADAHRFARVASLDTPANNTPTSAAIQIANNGGEFTGAAADSVLRVRIWYRTHAIDLSV